MAIIEGIQICIPTSSERAERVIERMEALLAARHHRRVGRRAFLTQWAKLRLALRLTRDYQELQCTVCHEAGGMCEFCKLRAGEHMHHEEPVAFAPRKALVRSNCKWTCVVCHEDADVDSRKRVLVKRRADRAAELAQLKHPAKHLPSGDLGR